MKLVLQTSLNPGILNTTRTTCKFWLCQRVAALPIPMISTCLSYVNDSIYSVKLTNSFWTANVQRYMRNCSSHTLLVDLDQVDGTSTVWRDHIENNDCRISRTACKLTLTALCQQLWETCCLGNVCCSVQQERHQTTRRQLWLLARGKITVTNYLGTA